MSGQVKEVSVQYQVSRDSCDSRDSMEGGVCPPGYKQTEVGVIPDEWKVVTLDELSEKIMVGIASAATHAYRDRGIPLLRNQNIKPNYLNDEDVLFITKEYEVLFKNKRLKAGDLLTARTGYPGTTCLIPEKFEDAQSFTTLITRLKRDTSISEYICYYMNSEAGEKFFELNQIGGGQKNVNAAILRTMPLPLPKKEEQTAIANALSDVDALITTLEKLITKKRDIKTAAMQQLLTGKKRLPPFDLTHTGYKQTELGEIPEDWEVVELGNIGKNIIGLTYSPNDVVEYGSLVLRSSNVQNNKLAFENNVFVNMNLPERVIVREGDILICVRNGSKHLIGKCALIDKKTEGAAFGAFMSIYRTEFSSFIFYQFQSDIIQRQIDEIMGATINQITNKDMSVFKVPLPKNTDEQVAIANVLSDMDKEIDALEQRLNKTQQLKQSMMQELLTGRTRLI